MKTVDQQEAFIAIIKKRNLIIGMFAILCLLMVSYIYFQGYINAKINDDLIEFSTFTVEMANYCATQNNITYNELLLDFTHYKLNQSISEGGE